MGILVSQICLQTTAHEDYGDYYFTGEIFFVVFVFFSRLHLFPIFLSRCLLTFLLYFFMLFLIILLLYCNLKKTFQKFVVRQFTGRLRNVQFTKSC